MRRKLGKRLTDIRGLLDRLGACMLSVNESRSFTVPRPSPSPKTRSANGPTTSTALPRHVTSPYPDVDLLLGSADESRAFLPPDRTPSTTSARNTVGDAGPAPALLQKELAHLAGQVRRNAEHFSGALGADQGVLRAAEEGGREPGGDEAGVGAGAGSPREDTRNDVSDDIERHRRRDCVFDHGL
ncbi:hypothetical protein EDB84DRAFT_1579764 [Lactarius hengduanensis]|nr:hypothetical protein EDB84DRAFT_1579764 [Lactarius hengduanensis]